MANTCSLCLGVRALTGYSLAIQMHGMTGGKGKQQRHDGRRKTGSSSYAFSESQSAVGTSGPRSFVLRGASVMTSCQTADSRQLRDKKRSTHRRSSSCATWGS